MVMGRQVEGATREPPCHLLIDETAVETVK
jgi:hypothetical protein